MWMTFQEWVLLCIFHILSGTYLFFIFYVSAAYYTYNELCVKQYVNHEMIDPELSLIFHILSA